MFITEKTYNKVLNMMEKGKLYVIPERLGEWCVFCFQTMKSSSARVAVEEYVYKIIKLIGSDVSVEGVCASFEDGVLPFDVWEGVVLAVVKFSSKGYEFFEATKMPLGGTTVEMIKEIDKENREFASQKKSSKR